MIENFQNRLEEFMPNGLEVRPYKKEDGTKYWVASVVDCKPIIGVGDTLGDAVVEAVDSLESFVNIYSDEQYENTCYMSVSEFVDKYVRSNSIIHLMEEITVYDSAMGGNYTEYKECWSGMSWQCLKDKDSTEHMKRHSIPPCPYSDWSVFRVLSFPHDTLDHVDLIISLSSKNNEVKDETTLGQL